MAGIDGVTPLNATNVQHKLSIDTRGDGSGGNGDLVFQNSAVRLTSTTLKVPFFAARYKQAGGPAEFWPSSDTWVPYTYILVNDPTSFTADALSFVNVVTCIIYEVGDFGFGAPNQGDFHRRGCVIETTPVNSSQTQWIAQRQFYVSGF